MIGRWVIISTDRARRPSDFSRESVVIKGSQFCPFCPGNENRTPPEILAYRSGENGKPDTPGWRLRVIPNKFPALGIEGNMDRQADGMFDRMNGIGAHEVLIAYRERMVDLHRDRRFRYVLIFKNHGPDAGATLEHTHTQLIATPIIPRILQEELDGSRRYFELKERCVFCDMIEQELREGRRIVLENEHFVSFEPFAPRFPFETWILPRSHISAFEDSQKSEFRSLAHALRETLQRINRALNRPHYNFIIHSAPCRDTRLDHYHWHIEIMPKLKKVAGFEWGTGFYINPTSPEEAAQYLREIEIPR